MNELINEKKNRYEEKKYYGDNKNEYDGKGKDYNYDTKQGIELHQNLEHISNNRNIGLNSLNKMINNEVREDMMYESTPQQFFDRKDQSNKYISMFASPNDPHKRPLPLNMNRINNTLQINDYSPYQNQSIVSLSSPVKQQDSRSNNILKLEKLPGKDISPGISSSASFRNNFNSPHCLKIRTLVIDILKSGEKSQGEQLEAIKRLLIEFKDYDSLQQDKNLRLIDNMIMNSDIVMLPFTPQVSAPFIVDVIICL